MQFVCFLYQTESSLQGHKTNQSDFGSKVRFKKKSQMHTTTSSDNLQKSLDMDLHPAQMTRLLNSGRLTVNCSKFLKATRALCLLSQLSSLAKSFLQETTAQPKFGKLTEHASKLSHFPEQFGV